ncbi:MAG TPA: hypothetical protein VIE44_02790 [Methylomirabilota bacterium]|jgi:hypothetical protein
MTSQKFTIRRRGIWEALGLSAALVLLALPAGAADEYPAPGYFLGGLSNQSSWNEILAKPGVKADFPYVGFESTFVPLSSVCVSGDMLAISDPRIDTGVRVSADELKAQARAAAEAGRYATEPGTRVAAATPSSTPPPPAISFPVKVYKVTERGILREWVLLFEKPWPIAVCPAK